MSKLLIKTIRFLLNRDWKHIIVIMIILSLNLPLFTFSAKYYLENQNLKNNINSISGESEKPAPKVKKKFYKVIKVIDGDSFIIELNGKTEEIRMLGINTPEIIEPTEYMGTEAKNRTKKLIENKKIFLLADKKNTDRDIYGRLLRYVYLENNTQINALLLKEGLARHYDYFEIAYNSYYAKLEQEAKTQKSGIWANI